MSPQRQSGSRYMDHAGSNNGAHVTSASRHQQARYYYDNPVPMRF